MVAGSNETVGAPQRRPLLRRRRLFKVIAVLAPLVVLLAVEGALRIGGLGGYPPVIRHVGSDGRLNWYSTYRPGVDSFFYEQLSHTGGLRTFAFTTPKPPGTVRIALFGGSAMQGYPQPLPLSNGAFLEAMLNDAWAGARRAEVLNFGATAMASFPARCFLAEMIPHELDLVIVMSGHNEYYGAYGVASLHRSGTSPLGMRSMRWLRSLAIKQGLDRLLIRPPTDEKVRTQTLMERVAAVQHVGPDDRLRHATHDTLRANLGDMVDRCRAAGVPIMVCTLPTNERGMAPIGEDAPPAVSTDQTRQFHALLAEAQTCEPAAAETLLRQAIGLCPDHAAAHFRLGRSLADLGRHAEALIEYVAARDLDPMPWRATSDANDAARQSASAGAVVCDMEAAFRAASPGGAIGWELMDDHVHMSLRGQALFAETIVRQLADLPPPLRVEPARRAALPGWQQYARRLGQNAYDAYAAASRMKKLFDISFMRRANPQAQVHFSWLCDDMLAAMPAGDVAAISRWHDPGLHVSNHRPITGVVGYYRMIWGDPAGAEPLFAIARQSVSNASLWKLQYTWYELCCRRRQGLAIAESDRRLLADAIDTGELLRRFTGFPDPLAPLFLGMAYSMSGRDADAVALLEPALQSLRGAEGPEPLDLLIDSLRRLGRTPRARDVLRWARQDPLLAPAAERRLADLDAPSSGEN